MKLPNGDQATVPARKVTEYLLSETHGNGRHKAAFFRRFGYDVSEWERLAEDLLRHGREHDVADVAASPFGTRYGVEGIIHAPDGRKPRIRTVWFVEHGEESPRLITAYPARDADD